ncbi:MAG: hypothetical protein ABFD46_05980 [Armatimonadota bacterium]
MLLIYRNSAGVIPIVQCCNGDKGWLKTITTDDISFDEKHTFTDVRDLSEPEIAYLKLYWLGNWNWRNVYNKVKLIGTQKINGKMTYAMNLTPKVGKPYTIYYDMETYLPIRIDVVLPLGGNEFDESSQMREETSMYPSDWRTIEGIKIPFVVTMKDLLIIENKKSCSSRTFRVSEFKINTEIDDNKFSKPEEDSCP